MNEKMDKENIPSKKQLKKEKMKRRNAKKAAKGKLAKKNMPQNIRLGKAKKWLETYSGDNILKAYRKKFAVGRLDAIKELQILGLEFSSDVIQKEKQAVEAHQQNIRNRKAKRRATRSAKSSSVDLYPNSNDNFFFIAGYTSGGAPYGVTWAEMGLQPYESYEEIGNEENNR